MDNEAQPKSELLQIATQSLLDSLPGLQIDPALQGTSQGLAQEVTRRAMTPAALFLTERGYAFPPETHTGEALISEIVKLGAVFNLPEELLTALREHYNGPVNWEHEAELLSDPTKPNPLRQLNQLITQHLSVDAQKALAKISFNS